MRILQIIKKLIKLRKHCPSVQHRAEAIISNYERISAL